MIIKHIITYIYDSVHIKFDFLIAKNLYIIFGAEKKELTDYGGMFGTLRLPFWSITDRIGPSIYPAVYIGGVDFTGAVCSANHSCTVSRLALTALAILSADRPMS